MGHTFAKSARDGSQRLLPWRQQRRGLALLLLAIGLSPLLADRSVAQELDLQTGLNLLSLPIVAPPEADTCFELAEFLGGFDAVTAITRIDPSNQQPETCRYNNQTLVGADFSIAAGVGYLVRMQAPALVTLAGVSTGVAACSETDLAPGVNLIGIPQPAADLGCYSLLEVSGPDLVSAVSRLNQETGRNEACAFDETAEPVGADFPMASAEGYEFHARAAQSGFNPNACAVECGDGRVDAPGEACDGPGAGTFCGSGNVCSADCQLCETIPGDVEMGLSGTGADGILQVGSAGELFVQIFDTEAPMLLTLSQDAMLGEEGSVCFRRGAGGPCTSTIRIATTGGLDNISTVFVEGLNRSLALNTPLLLNLSIGGVRVQQIPVALVETQVSLQPDSLVNDAPGGTINVTTLPPTSDFPIDLAWFRRGAADGAEFTEAAQTFNSVRFLQNGQVLNQLTTGADGTAQAELLSAFGGQGLIELDGGEPIGLFNPAAECCVGDGGTSVNPSTGANERTITDSTHKQLSQFEINRTYSNQSTHRRAGATGDVGVDWAFSFISDRLIADGGNVIVFRDTNRTDVFRATTDPDAFVAPQEYYEELRRTATGEFELRSADGTLKVYASFNDPHFPGRLIRQEDRNGNFMSFLYSELLGANKYVLTTAVDSMGRNVQFRYYPATDSNPGRQGRLWEIEDFRRDNSASGRTLVYDYDVEGNLISVRLPVIVGTPTGNNFPVGKTTRYRYMTDAMIPAGIVGYARERLRHNLIAIEYPNESATDLDPSNPQTLGTSLGTFRETFTYGTNTADPSSFDRVVAHTLGGTNANGVPAGGSVSHSYQVINPGAADANTPYMFLTRTDRRGNVTEITSSPGGTVLETRDRTRGFRGNEPPSFLTQSQYNDDKELISITLPEGNSIDYTFDSSNTDRFQQGNIIATRHSPGSRGGDQASLLAETAFEPIYNQAATLTDPRGLNPVFTPPIGDGCSGRSKRERYTRRLFFDYQEAPSSQILPLLAAELSIPESEVQARLSAAGVQLGLGDLNGDGAATLRIGGNVIRVDEPSVSLLSGSSQAAIEGDTCQEIVTLQRYNDFGQLTSTIDPEGNRHEFTYFSQSDPDGDGTISPAPADGRALGTSGGGYLQAMVRDTTAAAGRNNSTNPTPTSISESYTYDDLGNRTSVTNGRGVRTDYFVNEHHEILQITSAVAVPGTSGSEPVPLTAFAYVTRMLYDFNGNVVATQVEDRFDTSNTAGFVDTTSRYDILDQEIERTEEVDVAETLLHRTRYDANGNTTLVIAPEGNAQTRRYDARDLLFQTTRGAIGPTAETLGAPSGLYDPRGGTASTITYNVDLNGNVIETVDAADTDGSAANGSSIAGAGDVTRHFYDGYDDVQRTVDAAGNERLLTYDPARNVIRVTRRGPVEAGSGSNVDLSISQVTFDELNRRTQTDQVLFVATGTSTQRTPDIADGQLTPGDGRVTQRSEYDRLSRMTFEIEDDGDSYRVDYDGAGRQIKHTDPLGNTVEYAYDGADNLIESRETDVSQIPGIADEVFLSTMFYDSLDRAQQRVDNLGQSMEYRYDSRGNEVAWADANGPVSGATITRRVFTGGAATVNSINDFGNVVLSHYDGLNRLVRTDAVLTASGVGSGASSPGANIFGVKLSGSAITTVLQRDFGQSGDGLISALFDWDGNSLLASRTDDLSNRTDSTYDNLNRRLTTTKGICDFSSGLGSTADGCGELNSEPTTEAAQYDPDDNTIVVTDENGSSRDCSYDAINRVTSCSYNRAAGVIGTTLQTFEYDGLSRLIRATDDNDPAETSDDSITTRAYDSLSRVIEETQQIGGLAARAVSSGWRAENLRTGRIYPNGRALDATYDGLDRLQTIQDRGASQNIARYDYLGANRLLQRVFEINGTRETYLNSAGNAVIGYDGLRRKTDKRYLRADQSLVVGFENSWDRMSNKTSERKLHDSGSGELYIYDSAYRMTDFQRGTLNAAQTAIATPAANGLQRQQWDLDGPGNWTELTTTEGGNARLDIRDHTSFNEISFVDFDSDGASIPRDRTHDNNGNLIDEDLFSSGTDTLAFEWDTLNRLHRATRKSDGAVLAVYAYDAAGRRVRRTVTNAGSLDGAIDYYYDAWRVIEERDGADALTQQYVHGNYVDEVLILDRNLDADDSATGAGDQRLFYHQNTLSSTFALTDGAGTIVEGYQYDPYGSQTLYEPGGNGVVDFGGDDVVTVAGVSASANPFLFAGRRLDPETGLYNQRNRYMDPDFGRFLSRDPKGYVDGPNLYAYVGDAPATWVDPYGTDKNGKDKKRQCVCCCVANLVTTGSKLQPHRANGGVAMMHILDTVVTLSYKKWNRQEFGNCRFEWWEKTDVPAYPFVDPNVWTDLANLPSRIRKDGKTYRDIDTHTFEDRPTARSRPTEVKDRDTPLLAFRGGNRSRTLKFEIKVHSARGCGCAKTSMTTYWEQNLEWKLLPGGKKADAKGTLTHHGTDDDGTWRPGPAGLPRKPWTDSPRGPGDSSTGKAPTETGPARPGYR